MTLFERNAQGASITPVGARLLERARAILNAVARTEGLAAAMRDGVPETVRLGIVDDGYGLMIQDIAAEYRRHYPDVQLTLHNGASGEKRAQIIAGDLEAAVIEGPVLEDEVVAWPLMDVALQIILPPAWASELEHAELATVVACPWIFMSPACSYHALVTRLGEDMDISLDRRFTTDSVQACIDLVSGAQGISLMNRDRVAGHVTRGEITPWSGFHACLPRSIIAHRDRCEEPAIRNLIDSCLRVFRRRAGRRGWRESLTPEAPLADCKRPVTS